MLDVQELRKKIKEYFNTVSDEQLKKDLKECGEMPCPICGDHLAKDCRLKLF